MGDSRISAPQKPYSGEAKEDPEDLDPVFDPDELCRKLERYKFAQEECAKRRQQRLLDDEQRRNKRKERKLKEAELGIDQQHQLDKLIPAVQPSSNSSSTNLAPPRFVAIDPIVKQKQEEHQRKRIIERKEAEGLILRKEADRRRQEGARKQKQDTRPHQGEPKRQEAGLKLKQQTSKVVPPRQERRQSHLPYGRTERTHGSSSTTMATNKSGSAEANPYHHVPRTAKSDFQRTASADPLRRKNIHKLALPVFDGTTKGASLLDHYTAENGLSSASDRNLDSPLSPPLDWLQLADRPVGFNDHSSPQRSESDSDSDRTYHYKPSDRPNWAQADQIKIETRPSWGGKPSGSSNQKRLVSDVSNTTTVDSRLQNLSNRKSLLSMKSLFSK